MADDRDRARGVFLFEISDRAYGARVIAIVAAGEDDAREQMVAKFKVQFDQNWCRDYAELQDSCPVESGRYVEYEWQE